MSHIDDTVRRCLRIAKDPVASEEIKVRSIREEIRWFAEDALKLARNINETSVGPKDRLERLIDMEHRMGISKSPLL